MSSVGEGRFVEKFGSYLQLHSCLSFAASVRDESAIAHLLQAAEHDPSHRDAVREIQKSNDMLFYDTVSVLLLFNPFVVIRFSYLIFQRHMFLDKDISRPQVSIRPKV
jgi:hypothetical protein